MKVDLKKAIKLFSDGKYTCVLCKDNEVITCTERGVKPLIELLNSEMEFKGFCAADKIVGKAAAFLYILLGVNTVYAPVMSKTAIDLLSKHGINTLFDLSVEVIRNRSNTGICPMEKTVQDIDDPKTALEAIQQKLELLAVSSG